jgi:hypothetical protein
MRKREGLKKGKGKELKTPEKDTGSHESKAPP